MRDRVENKRKFFIYDRKEVGILILLGVGVSLFAFTLGVHLGKQVTPPPLVEEAAHAPMEKVETGSPALPSRTEISEQVKNVPGAVDDALDQSLRDEIVRNGLQLTTPKPLHYPDKTVTEKKQTHASVAPPAETHSAVTPPVVEKKQPLEKKADVPAAPKASSRSGSYALQVGSYPKESDAKDQLPTFSSLGLPVQIKQVVIEGKGTWYRILVGEFPSIKEADTAGRAYQADHKISEFRVVRAAVDGEKSSESR